LIGVATLKAIFLKTAFVLLVFGLTLILIFPANLALEALTPAVMDARGHGRYVDRLFPGMVVLVACLAVSSRITSLAFWHSGLSSERWSIFQGRNSRRSR
jgi:hypothetical protein